MPPSRPEFRTPVETQQLLADRLKQERLALGYKQATLAKRSGVSLASLRRFEQTGEIALSRLLRLCHALGRLEDFDALLAAPVARSMAELESRVGKRARSRGSR
ncbi:MAG TPA: helix-turn-helix transcriptional regulator [Tepidisphaeraceae bacterium]|nr:helix-turn-helix transcriptional regulator [Tepidisphaeraceae bacterium]